MYLGLTAGAHWYILLTYIIKVLNISIESNRMKTSKQQGTMESNIYPDYQKQNFFGWPAQAPAFFLSVFLPALKIQRTSKEI